MSQTPTVAELLPDRVRRFLSHDPPWFGTIATLDPDGSPRQAIVWYQLTDQGILVNSRADRRWPRNLRRDGRASISIGSEYDFVMIKGMAEVVAQGEQAQEDIIEMAGRYHADDPEERDGVISRFRTQERISFLLRPEQVHVHLAE